jgi:hypothetical protein
MKWMGMNSMVPINCQLVVNTRTLKVHTEFAVDSADEFVDNCTEVLVLLYVLSRRNGNLNQHNLADPLRVFCQENFKSVKLLRDTLDVIKTVNTNNQLDALELLLECLDTLCDLRLLEPFLELLGIDTDRECTNGDDLALKFDCVGCCWQLAVDVSNRVKLEQDSKLTGF